MKKLPPFPRIRSLQGDEVTSRQGTTNKCTSIRAKMFFLLGARTRFAQDFSSLGVANFALLATLHVRIPSLGVWFDFSTNFSSSFSSSPTNGANSIWMSLQNLLSTSFSVSLSELKETSSLYQLLYGRLG